MPAPRAAARAPLSEVRSGEHEQPRVGIFVTGCAGSHGVAVPAKDLLTARMALRQARGVGDGERATETGAWHAYYGTQLMTTSS